MSLSVIIATIMRPSGDTGVQTHFQGFAKWMHESGKDFSIETPFNYAKWKFYPVFGFRRIVGLLSSEASVWWYRYWHFIFLEKVLRKRLSAGLPCVVYAQCPLSAYAALKARKSSLQRVCLVTHFNISQADEWAEKGDIKWDGRLFKSIRKFENDVFQLLDGVVFVSDFMRRELQGRISALSFLPNKVVPNFIKKTMGENSEGARGYVGDLVCIGTLEPRKNQHYALEIISAAKDQGCILTLAIIGDGPDRGALMSEAEHLGVSGQIRFLGHVHNAVDSIPGYKAYLHVSKMESFGIVLIEAMSQGVPVFAPSVGGVSEIFIDGVEGRFIPLDNAGMAAQLIVEWLGSPSILERASFAAKERCISRFEEDVVCPVLFDFISNLDVAADTSPLGGAFNSDG